MLTIMFLVISAAKTGAVTPRRKPDGGAGQGRGQQEEGGGGGEGRKERKEREDVTTPAAARARASLVNTSYVPEVGGFLSSCRYCSIVSF